MPARKQMIQKGTREPQPAVGPMPTLEEVLVGFQKSIARATLAAYNVSKADPEFSRGSRTLYVTEAIDVDLRVGLDLIAGRPRAAPDKIVVDFQAPADVRSSLRFRVGAKPLEHGKGPDLVLTCTDPLGSKSSISQYRLYLVNANWEHIPQHPVSLCLAPRDIDADVFRAEVTTDDYGGVTFSVDGRSGGLTIRGKEFRPAKTPSFKDSVSPSWLLSATTTITSKEGETEYEVRLKSDIYAVQVYLED
jgi:hypothetical protein